MERNSGNIHGNGFRNISEILRVSKYKDSIKRENHEPSLKCSVFLIKKEIKEEGYSRQSRRFRLRKILEKSDAMTARFGQPPPSCR
jgi:hypothetical protein